MKDNKNKKDKEVNGFALLIVSYIKAFNWTMTGLNLILVIAFSGIGFKINNYIIPASLLPLLLTIVYYPFNEIFLFRLFRYNSLIVKTITILVLTTIFMYCIFFAKATLITNMELLFSLNR